jgi:hypothetical protein
MWITQLFNDGPGAQGTKLAGLYALLAAANLAPWAWALADYSPTTWQRWDQVFDTHIGLE